MQTNEQNIIVVNLINTKEYTDQDEIMRLLYSCAKTDNVDLMKFLFIGYKELIDINYQPENEYGEMGSSLLMTAMFYKSSKVAEFLLGQKGIDVNAKDWQDMTAFGDAVWVGFTDGVELINIYYNNNAEVIDANVDLKNSIEVAKSQGHIETLKLLQATYNAIMEKHRLENNPIGVDEDGNYVLD